MYSIVKNRSTVAGPGVVLMSFNIHEVLMRRVPRWRQGWWGISGLIYDKRERSRMPYQLINSVTGQVQRASRLQLTAIHREAAKKKSPACALPQDLEMPEKRLQPPVSVAA
ncbi:hypothetical protein MTP99_019616 [Tenebrio molitor]|jgi:hypothetical protein|nr:hypothetical protein MTP99_019616 [Tenebrio molitor]